MTFSKKKLLAAKALPDLYVNDVILEEVKSITFLGVNINNKLSWAEHKQYVRNKINRNIGILYKCRNILDKDGLVNIYNSFILPYLLYCLPVWGGTIKSKNDIIVKVQNKCLRILLNKKRSDDAWQSVNDKILPVQELYKLEVAKYCYKHSRQLLPKFFADSVMPIFAKNIHNVTTRYREQNNYYMTNSNTKRMAHNSLHYLIILFCCALVFKLSFKSTPSQIMVAPNCKQLNCMIEALREEVIALQSAPAVTVTTQIDQLRSEYDSKIDHIRQGYESRISNLEDKLTAVIKTKPVFIFVKLIHAVKVIMILL